MVGKAALTSIVLATLVSTTPLIAQPGQAYYSYCTAGRACARSVVVEVFYFNNGAASLECTRPRRGCSAARVRTFNSWTFPDQPKQEHLADFNLECDPSLGATVETDVKVNGKFDHTELMKIDLQNPRFEMTLKDQDSRAKWLLWKAVCLPLGRRVGPPDRTIGDE